MPERGDPKLFQVLCRQAGKNRFVYLVFAECGLVAFPRPKLRSQTPMSMTAPELRLVAYHPASGPERAYRGIGVGKSSEISSRRCGRASPLVGAKVSLEYCSETLR